MYAGVAKLVDACASGAYVARHGGSSPLSGTSELCERGVGEEKQLLAFREDENGAVMFRVAEQTSRGRSHL